MPAATFAIKFLKTAGWLFLCLLVWFSGLKLALAEQVVSFESDIVVQADSSLLVTETITYDFGTGYRHGIFRNISEKHAQAASVWYKNRYIHLVPISVLRNGDSEPYTLEKYAGLSLKIGRPDETITGYHVYEIKYRAEGALSVLGDDIELYWNVTGDQWPVSIVHTRAQVSYQPPVTSRGESYCYVGAAGRINKCDDVYQEGQLSIFIQGQLQSGQQLTVARSLQVPQSPVVLERINSVLIKIISLVVGFVVLVISGYRWRTKNKTSRPVIAQYEPYEDFKPMFTGVLFDSLLHSRDVSAGIVYLAQQGFISIKEIKSKAFFLFNFTDYEVELLREITESETYFHEQLLHLLFGVSGVQGETVKLSKIKKDKSKLLENSKIIQKLRKAIVKDLVTKSFLEQRFSRQVLLIGVVILIFSVFPLIGLAIEYSVLQLPAAALVMGAIYALSCSERRTIKGYEAQNYLKGFKLFLKVTEKERYKFHNAPALNQQQFMEYLPYAIAFGVEKEWAEVFKDIQVVSPGWYSSPTGNTFEATSFTTNLSSFSSSFSTSTSPSGSGGSGSSGGGSGGGGGGSW